MEKYSVVVLCEDIEMRVYIKNLITSEDIAISGYSDFSDAAKTKVLGMFPDVVLCAIEGDVPETVLDFLSEILCLVRNSVVVLLNDSITIELMDKCSIAGISIVKPLDISREDLEESLNLASSLKKKRHMDTNTEKHVRSTVLSFFGGKGGTGRSTLAVNTASALALAGKKVMLIDLDLEFGDIALSLDLDVKDTLVELVQDRGEITIDKINTFAVLHSSGINVLCAPKSPEYAEYVQPDHIERIIDVMRPYFEYIILDLSNSFSDNTLMALENSDKIMLVYNIDILSLNNAKLTMRILDQLHQKDKIKFIVNKNIKGLLSIKDFQRVFDMEIFGTVPLDTKVAGLCVNKGIPMVNAMPKTAVSRSIVALAQSIVKETNQKGTNALVNK